MTVQVKNITHTYRTADLAEQNVLNDVTFHLNAGEQLLLRGISGSGKTTLINILAGLLTPTAGTITINDQPIYTLPESQRDAWRRDHIGYVFQTHHLLPTLKAWENVALPLRVAGVSGKEAKSASYDLLAQLGLKGKERNRPSQLSVGQRQRVAIARALVNNPVLVLADEPTASLDESAAATALDLLQEHCRAQNTMLIVASHDPALNKRFGRIADLNQGDWLEGAVA